MRRPVLLLALAALGCQAPDTASPGEPELPPDSATAAPALEEWFAELAIEDADTGQRGLFDAQDGWRFSRKAKLRLAWVARQSGPVRVVVESRTTGATAGAFSATASTGSGTVELGSFPRDLYALHVIVRGARLASIPFASE